VTPCQPYRPHSGTAGIGFFSKWCSNCERDAEQNGRKKWDDCNKDEICPIIADTMAYDVNDPKYPVEWIITANDGAICTNFKPVIREPKPYRCIFTIDMFA
jgi:hypothetical protein